MISILTAVIIALAVILAFVAGAVIGYLIRDVRHRLTALKTRQDAIEHDQADSTPDVVVAKTPKQVREHKLDDDSESAIVDALSPKEIAERKKAKMMKDIEDADV